MSAMKTNGGREPREERWVRIRRGLLAHFDRAARDLPWRRDRTPYRVLVSEVMLQQNPGRYGHPILPPLAPSVS